MWSYTMRIAQLRLSRLAFALTLFAAGTVSTLAAQAQRPSNAVQTFMLQRLTQRQAAELITPYVSGPGSGVFGAGDGVHGVTVRGSPATLALVDSILRVNDRPPSLIRIRFKVIAATDSVLPVDSTLADIQTALQRTFSYRGYRQVSEGVVSVVEGDEGFEIMVGDEPGEVYTVDGAVRRLDLDDGGGTVYLSVNVSSGQRHDTSLLRTGLPVGLGKTIIVGSSLLASRRGVMIFALRPDRE